MTDKHTELDPRIALLLDGEISLADLPAELRPEAERLQRLLGKIDRSPVTLGPAVTSNVMAAVRRHAASPARRFWRWWAEPREVRVRLRPWFVGPALAAAAALVLLLGRPGDRVAPASTRDSTLVQFVFSAPSAHAVAIAGSFNDWNPARAPLTRASATVWTITLPLPPGEHQYAFVVDGRDWVADPSAPGIDDGLGRRNSIVSVAKPGARIL